MHIGATKSTLCACFSPLVLSSCPEGYRRGRGAGDSALSRSGLPLGRRSLPNSKGHGPGLSLSCEEVPVGGHCRGRPVPSNFSGVAQRGITKGRLAAYSALLHSHPDTILVSGSSIHQTPKSGCGVSHLGWINEPEVSLLRKSYRGSGHNGLGEERGLRSPLHPRERT